MLLAAPELEAKALFEHFDQCHPSGVKPGLLRKIKICHKKTQKKYATKKYARHEWHELKRLWEISFGRRLSGVGLL